MTLASTTARNDYTGNGATSTYSYSFRIFSDSDLLVTKRDTGNVETTLVLNTDYTVSGAGTASGSITLLAGALPSSYKLTIRRSRPAKQETDIRNQSEFFRDVHEDALDNSVMIDQSLKDSVDRSLKLPETEAGSAAATTLPVAASRASQVLGFDASGNPIAVSNVPTSGITVTSFIQTLLDDSTVAAARTTLGLPGALSGGRVIVSSGANIVEASAITPIRAIVSDASGIPTSSAATSVEVGYLAGVSSLIQPQLDGKAQKTTTVSAAGLATGGGDLSANRTVTVTAAVQADQETGSSNAVAVTPGVQHFHNSAAKFWVNFNGTGTIAIRTSYNVTSLTDNGVGDYTVTFTTAFSSANHCVVAMSQKDAGGADGSGNTLVSLSRVSALAAGSVRVKSIDYTITSSDPLVVTVVGWGDQ